MDSHQQIINDLTRSTAKLIETIDTFPDDHFQTTPREDARSAGQICEHLLLLEHVVLEVVQGSTRPTVERAPQSKIPTIQETFSNIDKKMHAEGPIVPSDQPADKEQLIDQLHEIRRQLTSYLQETTDLTVTCTDFTHGIFGQLTIIEWIYYIIYHSDRHLHQFKKNLSLLENK